MIRITRKIQTPKIKTDKIQTRSIVLFLERNYQQFVTSHGVVNMKCKKSTQLKGDESSSNDIKTAETEAKATGYFPHKTMNDPHLNFHHLQFTLLQF